jgi:hypothetical protein
MHLTAGSETPAKLNLTPGKYPKENIQMVESVYSAVRTDSLYKADCV